ncbi:hypothetical protein ZWY2020_014636 [Hordeum vulgare]|nr:hypothetical protein ZWY2020_014636 [Hordeum vulgare]
MTRSRHGITYIDNQRWGPEANSIESGYTVPFGKINIFIGMIGSSVPEPDISTDIVEPASVIKGKSPHKISEPAIPDISIGAKADHNMEQEDHPPRVDNPGDLALVVAPQVGGYTLSKVLMDGGSSINILYFDTFQRMNLLEKDLMPSTTVFHGIVPGKSAYPIGRVRLTVAFGTAQNYRSESLIFEVVKLKSPYHALFGRPAYARFMARPCYVYLKLKMPGPKGTITVDGDRRIAKECEEGDAAYAEVVRRGRAQTPSGQC